MCSFKNNTLDCKSPKADQSRPKQRRAGAERPISVSDIRILSLTALVTKKLKPLKRRSFLFVCCFVIPKSQGERISQSFVPVPGPVGQEELLEIFGVFPELARVLWCELDCCDLSWVGVRSSFGVECVVDAWLLKARSLPPSGSGPFPNPTQRNNAPPRGSWPLWAGGHPPCQGARPAAPRLGPRAFGAPRVRRGSGAVPLLTVVRGRRRALGAAHRHAAAETRGGRTGRRGPWTLPLGCSRDSHSARRAEGRGSAPR